jgi:hypothetical protein
MKEYMIDKENDPVEVCVANSRIHAMLM